MTREEQIDRLQNIIDRYEGEDMWQTLTDKRDYECIKAAIEALEQEPTEFEEIDFVQEHKKIPVTLDLTPYYDAISRQAVLECLDWYEHDRCEIEIYIREIVEDIKKLPSVQPQPKTGHWVELTELSCAEYSCYVCSECEAYAKEHSRRLRVQNRKSLFCPDCGLKMIESQESEDKE